MVLNNVLLGAAAVFLLVGFLFGWKRGLAQSFLRVLMVVGMAFLAFYFSGIFSDKLLAITVSFNGVQAPLHEIINDYITGFEAFNRLLSYSATLKGIVLALPDAVARLILFIPLFFLLKLVSLPISWIIGRIFAPNKNKDGSKKKRFALLGAFVGLAEGFFCFSVIMVLFFGVCDVGSTLVTTYRESGYSDEQLEEAATKIEDGLLSPMNSGFVGEIMTKMKVRDICVDVFHKLTRVSISTGEGKTEEIYYFREMQGLMPTVVQALKLQNTDPNHMTVEDTENVLAVALSVKNNEKGLTIVRETLSATVAEQIDPSYQDSAGVFLDKFLDVVVNTEDEKLEKVDVEAEAKTIESCMKLLASSSSEVSDSAFESVDATKMVETLVKSDLAYLTLSASAEDDAIKETIQNTVALTEESKTATADALSVARDTLLAAATDQAEVDKIESSIDSIYAILGLNP